jgi:hypothetical protein
MHIKMHCTKVRRTSTDDFGCGSRSSPTADDRWEWEKISKQYKMTENVEHIYFVGVEANDRNVVNEVVTRTFGTIETGKLSQTVTRDSCLCKRGGVFSFLSASRLSPLISSNSTLFNSFEWPPNSHLPFVRLLNIKMFRLCENNKKLEHMLLTLVMKTKTKTKLSL